MSFITIYITHETEEQAKKLAMYLVEKKLVACANLYPINSMYWWQAKVQQEQEWVSLLKTTAELWEQVKSEVENIHPYEVPCIMKTEVEANEAYENWIRISLKTK